MSFFYRGELPASKSMLNRMLIVQSFAPSLKILGNSNCEDVLAMRAALPRVLAASGEPANCAAAGTTFRFLALRASRIPGRHLLHGTPELLNRPQAELLTTLRSLGVAAELSPRGLEIHGEGWKNPMEPLLLDRSRSSQFASAVLLNAWNLDFELPLRLTREALSEGYFGMTKDLVRAAGMKLQQTDPYHLRVPRHSQPSARELRCETDLSSAFAVAALAAVGGRLELQQFPTGSVQPDAVFTDILPAMGCEVFLSGHELHVCRAQRLKAIDWNLGNCPDLFPVLTVLCALAEGSSRLHGAPQLAHKESSRIDGSAALLQALGVHFIARKDGMEIEGQAQFLAKPFAFDPRHDHRLAMAAAVARQAGAEIRILSPEVVNKSFPEFWTIAR